MPRPTSKTDLLTAIDKECSTLNKQLSTLDDADMVLPGIVGEWSTKDVLAHLAEWQTMVFTWYESGLRGETPALPALGFTWRETPALNAMIYEKYRDKPLAAVVNDFHASHDKMLALIHSLTNEQLFTASVYPWTRKNTFGTYVVSATSSHYLWASKEIRKGFKRLAQTKPA